ncbi:MAG: SDR family NAD(P)-dependent oxidoreductase [Geodermatophilaceae bacterium]|nr:SDR family NAD(P)-dependent oxidoreductase [Geodermatophilaceae bacterium]
MTPRRRTALITGGIGGFGLALARLLLGRDFTVALADLDVEQGQKVAEELDVLFIPLDVGDLAANHRAVALVESHYNALDAVFLNAGIVGRQDPTAPLDMKAYEAILDANLHGVTYGIDAAKPALRRAGGGRIVVTASLAGLVPMPGDPLYSMTKSAALAYSRAIAPHLAEQGITLSIVCPGFADTPLIGPMRSAFEDAGFPILTADDVAAALLLAHDEAEAGSAYVVQPGSPPMPYRFRNVPAARDPSGASVAVPTGLSAHSPAGEPGQPS